MPLVRALTTPVLRSIPRSEGRPFRVVTPGLLWLILAVTIGACGTSSGFSSQEQQFLRDVHRGASWPSSNSADTTLVGDGRTTCNALTRGVNFSEVESVLLSTRLTTKQASALVTSAVFDLCPQFDQQLESWVQQQQSS